MHQSLLVILAQILLPSPGSLSLDDFELTANTLNLFVSNRELAPRCTTCGGLAERIHSKYQRVLSDLPCCGRQIRIHWTVRRFFCDAPNCPKITFTEQLPVIAQRYARNTQRLADKLRRVGLEAGGEAGKRLSKIWDLAVSGDQLIRLVRSSVEQEPPTPHVMGIDDWAWRKRHTYGTILVDLERRCVVDLLPDRKPETIAQWLKAHPGVEIISRDRGNEMIKGIIDGAPQAIQVADRFHLMENLRSGLEHFLESKPACPLRPQCIQAKANRGRTVQLHPQEGLLQQARALQNSPEFQPYRQMRQTAEHRLARLVQLGIRQARYFGRRKTLFQLLMAATVANLTLIATKTGQMHSLPDKSSRRQGERNGYG